MVQVRSVQPPAVANVAGNRLARPGGVGQAFKKLKVGLQPRLTDTRKAALSSHLQLSVQLRTLLEEAGLTEERLQLRGGRKGGYFWQTSDAMTCE